MIDKIKNKLKWSLSKKYKKTYSQCGEDVIVSRILKILGIEKPFYIDIGTNDPIFYNNTYFFYKNGSHGICIEPNPDLYKKIKKARKKDTCLQIGVGKKDCELNYYKFKDHVLNTFSENEARELEYKGIKNMGVIKVPVISFDRLIDQEKIKRIDYLSIDVEGMDFEILESIDYYKIKPTIICIEIKSLNSDPVYNNKKIDDFLNSKEYINIGKTPINSIYVDKLKWNITKTKW